MRKYIRLALLLVAFISIIAMLFYKYQYHHLQTVLNLMNFFPAKPRSLDCLTTQSNYNMTPEVTFSSNYWTELFDGIYVYSPHAMKSYVFLLAFSADATTTDLKNIKCYSWFKNQEEISESKLVIHYLNEEKYSHFYFECWHKSEFVHPDAITFVKEGVSKTVPVFHTQLYTGQSVACINPSFDYFSDLNKLLEFLIYHSQIGIKHFLVYYTAFSSSVKEVLAHAANKCDIIIEFLPWITPSNYEHNTMKLQPYFIDCLFHVSSLNHSSFVFLLNLNEFIVLEKTKNIKDLINNNLPFDYIQMKKRTFCSEYPNDMIAKELNIKFQTLLKYKASANEGQEINVIYDVKNFILKTDQVHNGLKSWFQSENSYKAIKPSSSSIYSYSDCGSANISSIPYVEDKKMWSFQQEFFNSCIYKHAVSVLGTDAV